MRSASRSAPRRLLEPFDELDERADGEPRPALDEIAIVPTGARRPGDVEVHPRHPVDELRQEQCGRERAAVAARADVAQVRDLRLEQLPVVRRHRERPNGLADRVRGRLDLVVPRVGVAHEAGDLLLGDLAHTQRGLMREIWDRKDYQAMNQNRLHFTWTMHKI
jgi:hypothetical protein